MLKQIKERRWIRTKCSIATYNLERVEYQFAEEIEGRTQTVNRCIYNHNSIMKSKRNFDFEN